MTGVKIYMKFGT